MASKPSVTLTLAGDEKRLTDSFDRVGAASKQMADKVESSSKDIQRGGDRIGDLTDKADVAERRSMGFKDTLDGLTGGIQALGDSSLTSTEKMMALGQAGADFAGGIANFVLPALGNFAGFLKGPLSTAMTFVSSHPLLITIGLLTIAFITLWTTSETFRNVVIGVFQAVGRFISDVFGGTINWIVARWNGIVDFFAGLPGRIGQAFAAVGGFIGDAFKGGINLAVEYVNFFIRTINWLVDRVNDATDLVGIPAIPDIPQIPRLHTGGVFHSGQGEGLALLRDGERVSASGQGGAVELVATGSGALADFLNELINSGQLEAGFR